MLSGKRFFKIKVLNFFNVVIGEGNCTCSEYWGGRVPCSAPQILTYVYNLKNVIFYFSSQGISAFNQKPKLRQPECFEEALKCKLFVRQKYFHYLEYSGFAPNDAPVAHSKLWKANGLTSYMTFHTLLECHDVFTYFVTLNEVNNNNNNNHNKSSNHNTMHKCNNLLKEPPVLTYAKSTTCETEEKHTRQLCLHLDEKNKNRGSHTEEFTWGGI